MLKRFLGTRAFYRSVLVLLIPFVMYVFYPPEIKRIDNYKELSK